MRSPLRWAPLTRPCASEVPRGCSWPDSRLFLWLKNTALRGTQTRVSQRQELCVLLAGAPTFREAPGRAWAE